MARAKRASGGSSRAGRGLVCSSRCGMHPRLVSKQVEIASSPGVDMLSELGVVPPRKLLFALGAEGCVGVLRPARVAPRTGAVDRAPAVTRVHEATPLVGNTGEVADGALADDLLEPERAHGEAVPAANLLHAQVVPCQPGWQPALRGLQPVVRIQHGTRGARDRVHEG